MIPRDKRERSFEPCIVKGQRRIVSHSYSAAIHSQAPILTAGHFLDTPVPTSLRAGDAEIPRTVCTDRAIVDAVV